MFSDKNNIKLIFYSQYLSYLETVINIRAQQNIFTCQKIINSPHLNSGGSA